MKLNLTRKQKSDYLFDLWMALFLWLLSMGLLITNMFFGIDNEPLFIGLIAIGLLSCMLFSEVKYYIIVKHLENDNKK